MQAKEIQVRHFLSQNGTNFVIPVYQRNYDWERKQCKQILNDIDTAEDEQQYFIGSIVHKRADIGLTNMQQLVIIDGQQRITTLTLFLFRLAEIFKENNDDTYHEIWDFYIENRHDNSNIKLKLKPIKTDQDVFLELVEGDTNQIKEGNRLYDNYMFFKEKIKTHKQAKKLYKNFNYLMIVEIALDTDDNPQKIFQSLNSTGLELSQADLIRNFLLMNLEHEYQQDIYSRYWKIIEQNCFKKKTNKSSLSYFFRDYLTLRFNKTPAYSKTFEMFQDKFAKIQNQRELLEEDLEKIKSLSSFYNSLINPETVDDPDIAKEIKNLNKQAITVSYPFLLGVFADYKEGVINKEKLVEIIKLIQSFAFRRFICGVPTNALNKIFMSLHGNAEKLREKHEGLEYIDSIETVLMNYTSYQRFPTDEEVLENLRTKDIYSTQKKNKLYLLERLENEYDSFKETGHIDLFERDDISIEHIFPQTPSKEWKDKYSKEELEEMEARKNTIGNLTIVINNGSLGNRTFIEKRDLNKEESKGFRFSKFKLNSSLASLDTWDIEKVNERTKELSKKFLDIWKYPTVDYEFIEEPEKELDLFEIDDPTGKKIKYYTLNGERQEDSTYTDIHINVLKHLYNEYFERLFSPDIQEIVDLTRDKSQFRYSAEIEGGYYVDTNLSSKRIIDKLKSIGEEIRNSFELTICFEEEE